MGSLIFGTNVVEGRSFDNIKIQTSRAGVSRPIIFGRARPVVGNIIATSPPRIVVVREEQEGGKGGPSVEVENEEVYRTYAIRICEGPVTGIPRVWRNNEIIYDRDSQDATQQENNTAFLQKAEFFLGAYDQMPSAVLQAQFGIDNVHAYRGTCYMVMDDENLTGAGGAIPQYAFEVERCEGFVLTSKPYAVESDDEISVSAATSGLALRILEKKQSQDDFIDVAPEVPSISLRNVVKRQTIDPDRVSVFPVVNGLANTKIVQRIDAGQDSIDSAPIVSSISNTEIVIRYEIEVDLVDVQPLVSSIRVL